MDERVAAAQRIGERQAIDTETLIVEKAEVVPRAKLDGSGETITAHAIEDRLALTRISLPAEAGSTDGLVLAFSPGAGFSLSIEGQQDIVSGRVHLAEGADGSVISLRPLQPGWAANRIVRVACLKDADQMRFVTTIGPA